MTRKERVEKIATQLLGCFWIADAVSVLKDGSKELSESELVDLAISQAKILTEEIDRLKLY